MKKFFLIISGLLLITQVEANDGISSEMGHGIGGVVMAGGIVAIVDNYYPEYSQNRAMIGFATSSLVIVAEQGIEYALHGDAQGQMLDALWHIAGSALGAYLTDGFILSPVVKNSEREGKYLGLALQHSF